MIKRADTVSELNMTKSILSIAGILLAVYTSLLVFVYFRQRAMLFFPTHHMGRPAYLLKNPSRRAMTR